MMRRKWKEAAVVKELFQNFLERLRKITNFNQDSQPPHHELKPNSKKCVVFVTRL
jgi:hypothetical protein